MTLRLAAALLLLGAAAPSQNILSPTAWQLDGSYPLSSFAVTSTSIAFRPVSNQLPAPIQSFSQAFRAIEDGWYQLSWKGTGCDSTGCFPGGAIVIAGKRYPWTELSGVSARHHQDSQSLHLRAGLYVLRFESSTIRPGYGNDKWSLSQPFMRRVWTPATDFTTTRIRFSSHLLEFRTAYANVVVAAARRTSRPISIPGFRHGLELDLGSPHLILATGSTPGPLVIRPSIPATLSFPGLFLQSVVLGRDPGFGSRIYVDPF